VVEREAKPVKKNAGLLTNAGEGMTVLDDLGKSHERLRDEKKSVGIKRTLKKEIR